jgi:hypothetical protein
MFVELQIVNNMYFTDCIKYMYGGAEYCVVQ